MLSGLWDPGSERHGRSRSISAENIDGQKGGGGRATTGTGADAARELGLGWKVSPSIHLPAASQVDLARVEGPVS